MPGVADDHRRAAQHGAQRVLQLGMRAVRTRAAGADAASLQLAHLARDLLRVCAGNLAHERRRILRVTVDALGRGQNQQHLCGDEPCNHCGGLVVVHALVHLRALQAQVRQLPLAVLLVGDRVVVVDDRNRALVARAQQRAADVLALLRVVEVLMLHQQLAHAVRLRDEAAVLLHEQHLALRGVVGLDVLRVAGQLAARALHVVQPADLRRARRHPDHARAQLRAQAGKDVVVDVVVLPADQRHGADLADKFKVVVHTYPSVLSCARL